MRSQGVGAKWRERQLDEGEMIEPKPSHLNRHNAGTFQLAGVVASYHLRTPYPPALAQRLRSLTSPAGGAVVEVGCGTGEIARMLAPHVERIDAIDVSAPMLERARGLPGGDDPAIRWILGAAEDVELDGPYALAVAGDSLHWMEWETVLPRLCGALAPGALLAIVSAGAEQPPWWPDLMAFIPRYSVMQDFEPFILIDELTRRHLFERLGEDTAGPEPFERTVDEYIDALHATAGLPRERMGPESSEAFDRAVRRVIAPFAVDGILHLAASATVAWGTPIAPG